MNMIVAADANWGIGRKGELLVSIPNDRRHFREETLGKVVVYGRRTLATFPQGLPLAGRTNIILSHSLKLRVKGAAVVHSVEELLHELEQYDDREIYVIGGESVYREMLQYCDTVHVTRIDHVYDADAHFPDLDADPEWEITDESDEWTCFDIAYTFIKYTRKDK